MHLLFDLDGTLTDSREGIVRCIQHALRELGADVPDEGDLHRFIGPPLNDCFIELLQTEDRSLIERAIATYRARFEPIGIFENSVYPGTQEALASLRARGDTLHVVTAKPAVYARQVVAHFQLEPFFSSVLGPELSTQKFEKAALVRQVLSDNGVAPVDAIVIGDRIGDLKAARANGVRSIGVTWGYGQASELAEADYLVDTWSDLMACVERSSQ